MDEGLSRAKAIKRGKGTTKQCPVCGADYFASFSKLKLGRAKFCSVRCSMIGRPRPDLDGDKNPNWRGGGMSRTEECKRYRQAHPEKYHAHEAVRYAITSGKLVAQPCEVCGLTDKVHAHHDDYAKPLDVRWLCRYHHAEIHGGTIGGKVRRKYSL